MVQLTCLTWLSWFALTIKIDPYEWLYKSFKPVQKKFVTNLTTNNRLPFVWDLLPSDVYKFNEVSSKLLDPKNHKKKF